MANYLITGGAGFIGSNIARELVRRGEAVRILDNFSTGYRENIEGIADQVEILEGDIRNLEVTRRAAADMDYVLHQAALPSVPRSVKDPVESLEVGVLGTANLLIAARDAKVKRVVYAASSSAYGDQKGTHKIETMLPAPLSPYASCKLTGEQLCSVFTTCYGLETISLRYFNVFGPFQDPTSEYSAVIPLFITALLEGRRPVFYGDGMQTRDFTHVSNNVQANILAATAEKGSGMVMNIACGLSYSLRDLLTAINQALGTSIEAEQAPARVGDVKHSLADITLARETIDYEVCTPFEEGIRQTVEWYKGRRG